MSKQRSEKTNPKSVSFLDPDFYAPFAYIFPLLLALIVFWQVTYFDFLNYDDGFYVTRNSWIQHGLTLRGIRWAFCADLCFDSPNADYWQPITMISRMIDINFWGLDSHGHHATNLFLHLGNTAWLYFIFLSLTQKNYWLSAWIAAAFAVYPAQADIVSWVTARKDVLSTFFGFWTIFAYLKYVKEKSLKHYFFSLLLYACSLMSKPSFLAMPALLLVLDYWPLERFKKFSPRIIFEKGAFVSLSCISVWITLYTHSKDTRDPFFFHEISINLLKYLWDFIYPVGFSTQAVLLKVRPWEQTILPWIFVGFISWLVIRLRSKNPFLLAGWLWFLAGLAPVVAIPHAGRYLSISSIGLSMGLAWGFLKLCQHFNVSKTSRNIFALALLALWSFLSFQWAQHWKDSLSIGAYHVGINSNNPASYNLYAVALFDAGREDEAIQYFKKAIEVGPDRAMFHTSLATIFAKQKKNEEAEREFQVALALEPSRAQIHNNYGAFLAMNGKRNEAIHLYEKAILLDVNFLAARMNLAQSLLKVGRKDEALIQFQEAIRINPEDETLYNNLAVWMSSQKRWDEAKSYLEKALSINPNYEIAQRNLENLKNKQFIGNQELDIPKSMAMATSIA